MPSAPINPPLALSDAFMRLIDSTISVDPPSRRRFLLKSLGAAALGGALFRAGFEVGKFYAETLPNECLLPGEFEHHAALVLGWSDDETQHATLAEIAAKATGRAQVIILVPPGSRQDQARRRLAEASVPLEAIQFLPIDVRVPWVRDYGPKQVKSRNGRFEFMDTLCLDQSFPAHDDVPKLMGQALGQPVVSVAMHLEGGNLLTNGVGFCITTERIIEQNRGQGLRKRDVARTLRQRFGATQIVYLERLKGEPTEHVDMFATFVAADTLLLGSYQPEDDPINAAILDRNAERLENVVTAAGKLQIHRIPMPDRPTGIWATYTNVVYVNGLLLVPSYGPEHAKTEEAAIAVYRKLLPNWEVATIDCRSLIQCDGALHCATLPLRALAV